MRHFFSQPVGGLARCMVHPPARTLLVTMPGLLQGLTAPDRPTFPGAIPMPAVAAAANPRLGSAALAEEQAMSLVQHRAGEAKGTGQTPRDRPCSK